MTIVTEAFIWNKILNTVKSKVFQLYIQLLLINNNH